MQSAVWRSRPVFITSTFRDMHAERDWLRVHVFPVLEERLRKRFHHLEAVDLRWGVESASAEQEVDRERLVLTVCLREIGRSRPFLIGLLGDRYGWRPPAGRLREAAGEVGLDSDVEGCSVTEMEILYGVLRNTAQARRTWFYFREPLPYADMPQAVAARYNDAFTDASDAGENVERLAALKRRVKDAIPGRVRTYTATWDTDTQSVTGLADWGAQVLEDLWSDLEAETAEFLRQAPRTWQEQDRWALDEFIEGRARDFVGRTAITNQLMELATSPVAEGTAWGTCLTAEPGAGKSSLFGHLQRLLAERDVLVLAHAAGISVRSTQVDWMLRRWVGELAAALGEADPLSDIEGPDDVDQAFTRLLGRVARERRVVVLIDALNQFEPTTRATHLTWVPRLWPPNARLIATAIPGTASAVLVQRPGITSVRLDPIDRDEALDIVRGICARYHRTLNPTVEARLLDKHRDDGKPACGNALWLELAADSLNILGGNALERVDPTAGADGLVQLLAREADRMPADVAGLYGWLLDDAERNFGQAWTRAFVDVIAASRFGWRESELEALMPVLSGEAWDPLRLATLRRGLRAHVVQRGAHAQWDYSHAQLRTAAQRRLEQRHGLGQELHATIANYLLRLPPGDQLHQSETMVHLMQAGDLRPAAEFYGSDSTVEEARGATEALQMFVASGEADRVAALTEAAPDLSVRARVAERYLFDLHDALSAAAPLEARNLIAKATVRTWETVAFVERGNDSVARALAMSYVKLGDIRVRQGNLDDARDAFQAGWRILKRLTGSNSSESVADLTAGQIGIGQVLMKEGDLPGALSEFRSVLEIRQLLVSREPDNANWQRELAGAHHNVGAVLLVQGDLPGALESFQAMYRVLDRLTGSDPANARWLDDLGVSWRQLGTTMSQLDDLPGALEAFRASVAIHERVADIDPGNVHWQDNLAAAHVGLAQVLQDAADLPGAIVSARASLSVRERLAAMDPGSAEWQDHLAVAHMQLGSLLQSAGQLPDAVTALQACVTISRRAATEFSGDDLASTRWHGLAVGHMQLADVLQLVGDVRGAHAQCQALLAIAGRALLSKPDDVGWQRVLAVGHRQFGDTLKAQAKLPRALDAYQTSIELFERLASRDPTDPDFQRGLALSQERRAAVLIAQGDLQHALAAIDAGVRLRTGLATVDPHRLEWEEELTRAHLMRAVALTSNGSLQEAMATLQLCLTTWERLAVERTDDHEFQRRRQAAFDGVAAALSILSNAFLAQEDASGALAAVELSLKVRTRAAPDPGDVEWQEKIATDHAVRGALLASLGNLADALEAYDTSRVSWERLAAAYGSGDVLPLEFRASLRWLGTSLSSLTDAFLAQNDLSGARASVESSLALWQRLAAAEPDDTNRVHDLTVGYEQLGDVLVAQAHPDEALGAFQAGLAIAGRLVVADPGNATWLRHSFIGHHRVGEVLSARGDILGAAAAFRTSLGFVESLATVQPDDAGHQRDMAICLWMLAGLFEQVRNRADIARQLAAFDPDHMPWREDLSAANAVLAMLLEHSDRPALDYRRRCHEVLRHMLVRGMSLDASLQQLFEHLEGEARGEPRRSAASVGDREDSGGDTTSH